MKYFVFVFCFIWTLNATRLGLKFKKKFVLPSAAWSEFWKSGFFFLHLWFFDFWTVVLSVYKICVKAVESKKIEQKADFWTPFTVKSSYSPRQLVDYARNRKLQLASANFIGWIPIALKKSDLHACSIVHFYWENSQNFTMIQSFTFAPLLFQKNDDDSKSKVLQIFKEE